MPVVLLIWVRVSRPSVLLRPAARRAAAARPSRPAPAARRPEPGGRPTRPRRTGRARRPAAALRGRPTAPGGRPRRAGAAGWTLRGRPGRRAVLAAPLAADFAARAAAGRPRLAPVAREPAGLPGRRFGAAPVLPEPAEPAAAFFRGRPRLPAFSLRSSANTGSACSG